MNLLLAVSAGIDSIYMAERSFNRDLFDFPYTWSIAHCNFSLRGQESDQDELFVRNWCDSHNIRCFTKTFDTIKYAQTHKLSVEMAARELRYNWFYELCETQGFDAVCIAHNADDNIETLLLNMLRGCGSNGMKGMNADSGEWPKRILRPLLSISRESILSYMKDHKLEWREDRTNREDIYKRNALRHKVLPVFKELNPSFLDTFASDMLHIREVHEIASDYYLEHRDMMRDINGLLKLKHWKYVVYREMERRKFTPSAIADVCSLLESNRTKSGKAFFSEEYRLDVTSTSLRFSEISRTEPTEDQVMVSQTGEYKIAGRCFRFSIISTPDNLKPIGEKLFVSASKLTFPFFLRTWRSGDYIQPLGMNGRKKLSDLFVDLKIPSYKKHDEVVLVKSSEHDQNVLALIPHKISEHLRIDPKVETEVLMIEEIS